MKSNLFRLTISLIFISLLASACNPAEDKIETTHTIVTNKKSVNLYSDSIEGSKVVCKLKPGDQVFHPEECANGMVGVALYEFGPSKGYIKAENISSDTTFIAHSSVLRDEYEQEIVPDLDEKFDFISQSYLELFPIKEGGFWTYAIILAIGIAILYGVSNIDVPIGGQLFGILITAPFAIWIAFNIHTHALTQVDGFLYRLIIILEFLALAILMITAITASIGKLIGHNFTFKFSVWATISIYLIYLGVAYIHSLCDFFFKAALFVFAIFGLYYFIDQIRLMIRYAGFSLEAIGRLLLNLTIFILSIAFIYSIMIPLQWVSSILFTQLLGALLVVVIPILFLWGIASSPSGDYRGSASWHSNPKNDGSVYEHQISGGLTRGSGSFDSNWYDSDGNKYEETSPGRYKKID